jgi:hypothetical protein
MHEINVSVISPQEAHDSVAEFWSGGRLIGFTHIADGDLMLQLEPHHDGSAVLLGVHGLLNALAQANRLLASH